jgi:hypothetical protein
VCGGKNAWGNNSDNILPGKSHGGIVLICILDLKNFKLPEPNQVVVKKDLSCFEKSLRKYFLTDRKNFVLPKGSLCPGDVKLCKCM